jgi:hypothetical protein
MQTIPNESNEDQEDNQKDPGQHDQVNGGMYVGMGMGRGTFQVLRSAPAFLLIGARNRPTHWGDRCLTEQSSPYVVALL